MKIKQESDKFEFQNSMQKSLIDMEDGPQKESVKIFDIFSLLQDPLQDLLDINGVN